MRRFLSKKCIAVLAIATAMTLTADLAARSLLRHISVFLSFDAQFSDIFAQIHDARMQSPWLLTMAIATVLIWALHKFNQSKKRPFLTAVFTLLLWLALVIIAVMLTRVNSIRFLDVVVSLLDILQKGGLS